MNYQTKVSAKGKPDKKELKKEINYSRRKPIMPFKGLAWSMMLIVTMLFANPINAQKIKDDNGLITLNGKPYVKLLKKAKYLIVHNNFWVQNLDGKELLFAEVKERTSRVWNGNKRRYVDQTSYYYIIHFKESGAKVVLDRQISKRGLIKMLFKNKLIKVNQIDPVAERNYIVNYGGSIHGIKSTASVVIKDDQIFHYDKLIGNFMTKTSTSENENLQTIILVYNTSGEKVAEAVAPNENAIEWSVFTYRDEKMSYIRYEDSNEREKLFKWISDKKYL